jgi:hypothetical protein
MLQPNPTSRPSMAQVSAGGHLGLRQASSSDAR